MNQGIWFNPRISKGFFCRSYLWNWFWKMTESDSEAGEKGIQVEEKLGSKARVQETSSATSVTVWIPKWLDFQWIRVMAMILSLPSKRTCQSSYVHVSSFQLRRANCFHYQWKEEHWRWIDNCPSKTVEVKWYFIGMKTLTMAIHIPNIMVFVCRDLRGMENVTQEKLSYLDKMSVLLLAQCFCF